MQAAPKSDKDFYCEGGLVLVEVVVLGWGGERRAHKCNPTLSDLPSYQGAARLS